MDKLVEGMRANDLVGLVLPLISIDEYVSKIMDSAIVIGFYVHDKDAATDLNRFLQKSPIEILDTDLSSAPDSKGWWLVFLELTNTSQTAQQIKDLASEVSPLVNINDWQMRVRGHEIEDLNVDIISKHLKHLKKDIKEEIMTFLKPSALKNASLTEHTLSIINDGVNKSLSIVDYNTIEKLLEKFNLKKSPIILDNYSTWKCSQIEQLLGENWNVNRIDDYIIIHNDSSDNAILVKF